MSTGETPATDADVDELRQVITADWLPVMAGMADWLPVLRDMAELDRAGALGGIRAIVDERLAQVRRNRPAKAEDPFRLAETEMDFGEYARAAALLAAGIDRLANWRQWYDQVDGDDRR